ncbi:MAG: hypothetical protein IAG10_24805, partial [Planctomycetaceae bacterium]|nr:hypothetical protein [Planctomycetaceae bacterium]
MLDTPQITQTAAQLTAIIRLTISREEIRNVMGPGIGELMAAIASQGIAVAGPWFSHHLKMDPNMERPFVMVSGCPERAKQL